MQILQPLLQPDRQFYSEWQFSQELESVDFLPVHGQWLELLLCEFHHLNQFLLLNVHRKEKGLIACQS